MMMKRTVAVALRIVVIVVEEADDWSGCAEVICCFGENVTVWEVSIPVEPPFVLGGDVFGKNG